MFKGHSRLQIHDRHQISRTCLTKVKMAEFSEPNKAKMQVNVILERLWKAVPESVKEFPWKKAEDQMIQRLLFAGKKAFTWSLIPLFIMSSLSDIIFSISKNTELLIPLGLFVGCLMTDFFKETAQELFRDSQEQEKDLSLQLLGIACIFLLVKFISTYFAVTGHVFLLNVANGGLMQALWLWKRSPEDSEKGNA